MVETPGPVDGDVRLVVHELLHGAEAGAGVSSAEVVHPLKHGTVVADIEPGEAAAHVGDTQRVGLLEELDVILIVELGDVVVGGLTGSVDRHEVLEVVVEDQGVSHGQAVGLHRVSRSIVIVSDLRIIKVTYSSLGIRHIELKII